MYRSVSRDETGVTEIGLNSLHWAGLVVLGTGVMSATFHRLGTTPADINGLNSQVEPQKLARRL